MNLLGRALVLLIAACAPGASFAQTVQKREPSYDCSAGREMADGRITVSAHLSGAYRLGRIVVAWHPVAPSANLRIDGLWEAPTADAIDFQRGLLFIDYDPKQHGRAVKSRARQLALRVNPTPPWQGYAGFVGTQRLQYGVRLTAEWADIAAFARGAGTLHLLVQDRRRTTIEHHRLPASLFNGFEPAAREAIAEVRAKATDYQSRCAYDDGQDVIVT